MTNFLRLVWINLVYYLSFDRVEEALLPYRSKKLRQTKSTDIQRWKKNSKLDSEWNERTALLGEFIPSNSHIIEFGAGAMFLKTHLTNYQSYTPADIVKRFEETIVCDLNQPIRFELSQYDVAVFSGVLEYVYDIDAVFQQLSSKVERIVLSYCVLDHFKNFRTQNGWLSDYTKAELEAIFEKNNYQILDYKEWRNQSLYHLILKN